MNDAATRRVILECQRIGLSANRSLLTFRGAGGQIRRERWLEMWREAERSTRIMRASFESQPKDAA